jgi:hypothetical protein
MTPLSLPFKGKSRTRLALRIQTSIGRIRQTDAERPEDATYSLWNFDAFEPCYTTDGLPLGLAAVKFWTRKKFKGTEALKKHINPIRVPIEKKESVRWLKNLIWKRHSSQRAAGVFSTRARSDIDPVSQLSAE